MKKEEKLKEERLAELLKKANGHPITRAILAEEADKILEERLLAAAKLQATIEEASRVIPQRLKEVDALVAHLAEYDEGRKAIRDKLTSARAELMKERQRLDWEQSQATAALLSNYNRCIDETILFFRDRFESLRVKDINKQTRTGETNIYTEKKETFIYSGSSRKSVGHFISL